MEPVVASSVWLESVEYMKLREARIGILWKSIVSVGFVVVAGGALLLGGWLLLLLIDVQWTKLVPDSKPNFSITDLVLLITLAVATPLLLVAVWRRFRLWLGSNQFVLEPFEDASGYEFSQKQLLSISLDTWQRLSYDVGRIRHRVEDHKEVAGMTTFAPLPKGFELEMEKKLVNADDILAKYAPDKMNWLLPLINYLFPARAIRVSCSLRRIGSAPAFSFSIIDTTGKIKPEVYSVYADTSLVGATNEQILDVYHSILPRVVKSLALEMCKYEMLAHYPARRKLQKVRSQPEKHEQDEMVNPRNKRHSACARAQVYNFVGMLYALYLKAYEGSDDCLLYQGTSVQSANHVQKLEESFFYKQAVHNFEKAIEYEGEWDYPYANLAEIHSLKGQQLLHARKASKSDRAAGRRLERLAQSEYEHALERYRRRKQVENHRGSKELSPEVIDVTLRLRIGRLRAMLLSGDSERIEEAIASITCVSEEVDTYLRRDHEREQAGARMLYYMACCCAIAYHRCKTSAMHRLVLRYLAYSLARNAEGSTDFEQLENEEEIEDLNGYYWRRAAKDPDFTHLHLHGGNFHELDVLKKELMEQLHRYPRTEGRIRRLGNREVDEVVDRVEKSSARNRGFRWRSLPFVGKIGLAVPSYVVSLP